MIKGGLALILMGGTIFSGAAALAAPSVEIRHAVARVTVIPEARSDVSASLVKANGRVPVRISRTADGVLIEGDLHWFSANCKGGWSRPHVGVPGVGDVAWDDLPQIVVRTPRSVTVSAGNAVFGSIGPGETIELNNSGCGDWTVADQSGPLRIHASGSGDVHAGSAASAEVHVAGSSDIALQTARDGLTVAVSGSGDVSAATVNGPLRVRVAGSGDVKVHDGAVSAMNVSVAGSGDVRFGGVAQSLEANVAGSGDISVGHVTGSVTKHIAGSGDVSVGR